MIECFLQLLGECQRPQVNGAARIDTEIAFESQRNLLELLGIVK